MNKYRFVHLSDIHFGQERPGDIKIHSDVREQLLSDCEIWSARLGPATGVIVTGDIAYSGKTDEYTRAGEWLDRLTEIIGCEHEAVHLVPGNHDIDRLRISRGVQMWHDDLRRVESSELENLFESLLDNETESDLLFEKLASYIEFASGYADIDPVKKPVWTWDLPLDRSNTLCLVGMNTVQVSDKLDSLGRMVLGANQYILTVKKNVEYVALMHHPLEWMKDVEKARDYLKRVRVLMFGHEHKGKTLKVNDGKGNEWLELYAGATNPPEIKGETYHYSYNWIEFSLEEDDGKAILCTVIHPRIWRNDPPQFTRDDAYGGSEEEGVVMKLTCPHFTLLKEPTIETKHTRPAETQLISASEEGSTMGKVSNEDQFSKLRFYFWRHLDWRQRLTVLSKLNALPESLDKPIPQTMERLALDGLNKSGRLRELWKEIMEYVPENKRGPNPFTQEGERKV